MSLSSATTNNNEHYDRAKELERFDDTKAGVKGLMDSGITIIPPIYIQPLETLSDLNSKPKTRTNVNSPILTIDLSGIDSNRCGIVDQVKDACRQLGFFQIINHGIPIEVLDRSIKAVRAFHEQPTEVKAPFYKREFGKGVAYYSNHDLFHSKAASWRDILYMKMGPTLPNLEDIPEICRNEVLEWDKQVKMLGEILMELMCEGLGVKPNKLKELTCLEGNAVAGNYYPYCPQPDLTIGIPSHMDPGVLTVLLQDHIGGLQIKHNGEWLDVKPMPGALVINVGDLLQIMSNDEYQSVEHRVLANPHKESRVSITVFLGPGNRENIYGPFPELISSRKPALYKEIPYAEYVRRFFSKELDNKTLLNYYRL